MCIVSMFVQDCLEIQFCFKNILDVNGETCLSPYFCPLLIEIYKYVQYITKLKMVIIYCTKMVSIFPAIF